VKLERVQQICTSLKPDRVLRLARGVLHIEDETANLSVHQILCLALANWMEGYGICNEAQTMMFFSEFKEQLEWYSNELAELIADNEYELKVPLLVMLHDYRYCIMHKPDVDMKQESFFDIRESMHVKELPEATVTYISVDCAALMSKIKAANEMIARMESGQHG
jgi:hypothetical protein